MAEQTAKSILRDKDIKRLVNGLAAPIRELVDERTRKLERRIDEHERLLRALNEAWARKGFYD